MTTTEEQKPLPEIDGPSAMKRAMRGRKPKAMTEEQQSEELKVGEEIHCCRLAQAIGRIDATYIPNRTVIAALAAEGLMVVPLNTRAEDPRVKENERNLSQSLIATGMRLEEAKNVIEAFFDCHDSGAFIEDDLWNEARAFLSSLEGSIGSGSEEEARTSPPKTPRGT